MLSAILLLLAGAAEPAAHVSDTIRHLKGQHSLPVAAAGPKARAAQACHPDPSKARACRHHMAQAQERQANVVAHAEGNAASPQEARW